MSDDVKEILADDGRQVLYCSNENGEPADTEEWIASDTIMGSDR